MPVIILLNQITLIKVLFLPFWNQCCSLILVAGSNLGISDDDSHNLLDKFLGNQLESKGITWYFSSNRFYEKINLFKECYFILTSLGKCIKKIIPKTVRTLLLALTYAIIIHSFRSNTFVTMQLYVRK